MVLASDSTEGRFLLEDVAGEDAYSANEEMMLRMVESLVLLQHRMASDPKLLLATGVSDRRRLALLSGISGMVARDDVRAEFTPSEQSNLDHLIEMLPAELDALDRCGLPDMGLAIRFSTCPRSSSGFRTGASSASEPLG